MWGRWPKYALSWQLLKAMADMVGVLERPNLVPEGVYDLIVIGAGINGLGIAHDGAARGLRVALVEKEDIGSGTSNLSGRFIHGGLRYLEQWDFALVRESLRERECLLRVAPHLVKPVSFMLPFYHHNRRSKWTMRAAMIAYDLFSLDKKTASHKILSRKATLQRFPHMDKSGLQGCAIFTDAQIVWSERLCTEMALAAYAQGCCLFTHARIDGFLRDGNKICGVTYQDQLNGACYALYAPVVVNAAGPWVDFVLKGHIAGNKRFIGGAKGSHLILKPFRGAPKDVIYYESRHDGRLVLLIPWGQYYMIGTTDKRYDGNPDEARAEIQEIDYLLGEVNALIPAAKLTQKDILYTYSGVRPLPFVPDKTEWKVPRGHVIHAHGEGDSGLFSIIGGKLTTYRSLAQEAVDVIFSYLGHKPPPCQTAKMLFPGARVRDFDHYRRNLAKITHVGQEVVDRLLSIYGARAGDILMLGKKDPALLEIFDCESGAIGAELVFTYENEFCRTLTDVLMRRTMVGLNATLGHEALPKAAAILAKSRAWSRERERREIADYKKYTARFTIAAG